MEKISDSQKHDLKAHILTMGGIVEKAIEEMALAFQSNNPLGFQKVHRLETEIDANHVQIDEECVTYLAKQNPVASELRLVVSIIKINSDLERMGDQCVNVAHLGREYLERRQPLQYITDIRHLLNEVKSMVRASLDCFVHSDIHRAELVLKMDDNVDHLKSQLLLQLKEHMRKNAAEIDAALDLLLVARNLERIGDHATNIAEDVIFASTGKDVRHGGRYSAT